MHTHPAAIINIIMKILRALCRIELILAIITEAKASIHEMKINCTLPCSCVGCDRLGNAPWDIDQHQEFCVNLKPHEYYERTAKIYSTQCEIEPVWYLVDKYGNSVGERKPGAFPPVRSFA